MKLIVISIRDIRADRWMSPQFVASIGGAIRGFGDEVNRAADAAQNPFYHHPEDFEMYHLGFFDDENGQFELNDPKQLALGSNLKR